MSRSPGPLPLAVRYNFRRPEPEVLLRHLPVLACGPRACRRHVTGSQKPKNGTAGVASPTVLEPEPSHSGRGPALGLILLIPTIPSRFRR